MIAIIAILAAILFPVFAQAREKARAITCISNLKQIGLGFLQYNQDNDEDTLNIDKGPRNNGPLGPAFQYTPAWYILLDPYVKDINLFYCPDRTVTSPHGADNYYNPTTVGGVKQSDRLWGYGYNDGLVSDGGYGLIGGQVTYFNTLAGKNENLRPGTSIARITSPAQMVAFGDTYDNLSIALDNIQGGGGTNAMDSPTGTSGIRHTQLLNYAFADGHAHTIRMVVAKYTGPSDPGLLMLLPARQSDAMDWCYDPNAKGVYDSAQPTSNPISGNYPLDHDLETCTDAVTGIYNNSAYQP